MSRSLHARIEKRFDSGRGSQPFELQVEFVAEAGITVLFGPSGAGKTLTLEALAGFSKPDAGRISFGDKTLFDSASRLDLPARDRSCGYLFQQDTLFPHMSVRENVAFGAGASAHRVDELLLEFHIDQLASRRPREISGGERQRCSIARTLAHSPDFLLMDEPAQGLDIALRRELHGVFRRIRDQFHLPMLLVTHDISEALSLGDALLLYSQGRIVQAGPARHVFEHPASAEAARLMGLGSVLSGVIENSDAQQNHTVINVDGHLLQSVYLDNCRSGDAVEFCIHESEVQAFPLNEAAPCSDPFRLLAVEEGSDRARLLFEGGIGVAVPRSLCQQAAGSPLWSLKFPSGSLSILSRRAGG